MTKLTGRGGPGRGQGRKSLPPGEKKQQVALVLSPDLIEWLANNTNNRNRFIEEAIREKIASQNL